MLRRQLLFAQFIVLLILLGVVHAGLSRGYLWDLPWFSAIAHFLGGLWVLLAIAWVRNMWELPVHFALCIAAVFVVGICWEIFEYMIGATHFPADTVDTAADLCMDLIGAIVASVGLRYIWQRK